MISGAIIDICAVGHHGEELAQNHHMRLWPIIFFEVPDIDKVSVENKSVGLGGLEIL